MQGQPNPDMAKKVPHSGVAGRGTASTPVPPGRQGVPPLPRGKAQYSLIPKTSLGDGQCPGCHTGQEGKKKDMGKKGRGQREAPI